MDTDMYLLSVLVIGIIVSYSQMDAATPRGNTTLNEFKSPRVRPLAAWVFNLTRQLDRLWSDYAQQLLLQSQIAVSLTEYVDAITADNDYNQTCLTEQKNKYTQLKLKAINDYHTCLKSQGLTVSANFTEATEIALPQLKELDKLYVYVSSRCEFQITQWYLSSFIKSARDSCLIYIHSAMNRRLRSVRDTDLMELYRKSLLMVLINGKQLDNCISTSSASSIGEIRTSIEAVSKCIRQGN